MATRSGKLNITKDGVIEILDPALCEAVYRHKIIRKLKTHAESQHPMNASHGPEEAVFDETAQGDNPAGTLVINAAEHRQDIHERLQKNELLHIRFGSACRTLKLPDARKPQTAPPNSMCPCEFEP